MKPSATTPPTAPPIIAPVLALLFVDSTVDVGLAVVDCEDDDDGEFVTTAVVGT